MRTLTEMQMSGVGLLTPLALGLLALSMAILTMTFTICKLCDLLQPWGRTTREVEQFSGPLQRGKAYQRIMTLTCWQVVEFRATCSPEFLLTYEVRYRTLG